MTNQQLNNEVFASLFSDNAAVAATTGGNRLSATAQLTALATDIANKILAEISNNAEEFEGQILASQKSHDAMDDLINEVFVLGDVDIEFLKAEDEETIERMIRSQQSKRSRSKAKAMTRENYLTMMTGAVAENLLRLSIGKFKSSGGGASSGEIGFSEEDLEKLAMYPEELKKAIRNVQSKKSIMKSKVDFDEESPRWLQLLHAEQQLKEVRDRVNGVLNNKAKEALEATTKVEELLADKNLDEMHPDEAKALLDAVRETLAGK